MFQSAPRAGARGDLSYPTALKTYVRFNPLPARVRGEICVQRQKRFVHFCFNPLPARVRGEITGRAQPSRGFGVSIRSPRGCAGRCDDDE